MLNQIPTRGAGFRPAISKHIILGGTRVFPRLHELIAGIGKLKHQLIDRNLLCLAFILM